MTSPKPQQFLSSYGRTRELALGIVKEARKFYDSGRTQANKKAGLASPRTLKSDAGNLRHAAKIIRKIDSAYVDIGPGFPSGLFDLAFKPNSAALAAMLLERARFLEDLADCKGGKPADFFLTAALGLSFKIKGLYELRHGGPHWKEIGDVIIEAFGDALPRGEDTLESATWARKTFRRYKNFAEPLKRARKYKIRRMINGGTNKAAEPKLLYVSPNHHKSLLEQWAEANNRPIKMMRNPTHEI